MKLTKESLRRIVREEIQRLREEDQPSDADIDSGKMHDLLGIPEDEEIEDHYSSGKQLASDLASKVGQTKAVRMVTWASNMTGKDLFRVAKDELKQDED